MLPTGIEFPKAIFPGIDHLRGDPRYANSVAALDMHQALMNSITGDYLKRAETVRDQFEMMRLQRECQETMWRMSKPAIRILNILPSRPFFLAA